MHQQHVRHFGEPVVRHARRDARDVRARARQGGPQKRVEARGVARSDERVRVALRQTERPAARTDGGPQQLPVAEGGDVVGLRGGGGER